MPKTIANLILNYIGPTMKRLGVEKNFIRPEDLAVITIAIDDGRYKMYQFKEFINNKEKTYWEDMKTFGHPFIIDTFEVMGILNKTIQVS